MVWCVQPEEGWNGGVGFITKEMIQTHCPPPAHDIRVGNHPKLSLLIASSCCNKRKLIDQENCLWNLQILRCGPPAMNKAMAAHLDAIGYYPDMQFQFWLFSPIGHSMNGQGWWETLTIFFFLPIWICQAWDWLTQIVGIRMWNICIKKKECEIIDYPMMRIETLNLTVW